MKQITITLPDTEAMKFVSSLLDMGVTFTVTTTVAKDPMVFAAAEALPAPKPYRGGNRAGRKMQRLTPDGRTAMDVVEAKVAQFAGRKFSLFEIKDLAAYSGFEPTTLQSQLQILVAKGRVVKLGKSTFREMPKGKRASPLPNGSQGELPLTGSEHTASAAEGEAGTFVSGEGWREPA